MPIWALALLILVALLACPMSMWVLSKTTRRKMSCPMCAVGAEHGHAPADLEARKATVDREIAQVRAEIDRRRTSAPSTAPGALGGNGHQ